jgi:hypothetical protein
LLPITLVVAAVRSRRRLLTASLLSLSATWSVLNLVAGFVLLGSTF